MKRLQSTHDKRVKAMHITAARFMKAMFDVVLLPNFQVSKMVRKGGNISAGTRRQMLSLQHYEFRKRAKQVFKGTPKHRETHLIMCDESYTTKCCGNCSKMVPGVGASKVIQCPFCKKNQDRDCNGARNIYIKGIFQALIRKPSQGKIEILLTRSLQRKRTVHEMGILLWCVYIDNPEIQDHWYIQRRTQRHPLTWTHDTQVTTRVQ